MKFASKSLVIALAAAAALLSGCAKKPSRPDPNATIVGPNTGGGGLNGTGLAGDNGNTVPSDLTTRDSTLDQNNQDRTTLASDAVLFDFNASSIKASERPKLAAAKDYLSKNPTYKILLEGHCDWRGTAEYNLSLGDRRANEAKKYLLSLGVSADKIDTVSKGSEEATKNADEGTMAKERCVNLVGEAPGGGAIPISASAPATPTGK